MGDEWFGQDVDKLFAYQTGRVVKIYDRTLGLVKNTLTFAIFVYIFIFNIWYKGSHFAFSPVEGIARLQWQEPTQKCNPYHTDCEANYQGIKDLPYCKQYTGGQAAPMQRECDYFDARELPINVMDGVLLPTYVAKYKQVRACPIGAVNCAVKWRYANADGSLQTGDGYAKFTDSKFVADAEDFTLLIDHTFRTGNGKVRKDDFDMQGYWRQCDADRTDCDTKPIKCVHSKCEDMHMNTKGSAASFLDFARTSRNSTWAREHVLKPRSSQGRLAPELDDEERDTTDLATAINMAAVSHLQTNGLPGVIAIQDGDVLTLSTLLAMAGDSLDATLQYDGAARSGTPRDRGMALVVTIKYENLVRWTLFRPSNPPWYTISVTAMPADTFKHSEVIQVDSDHRDVRLSYGTMVIVKQTGNLAFFDPMFALISFTSAMALLAVANTLTELLMLNILPQKEKYQVLKYKESEDFHRAEKEAQAPAGS